MSEPSGLITSELKELLKGAGEQAEGGSEGVVSVMVAMVLDELADAIQGAHFVTDSALTRRIAQNITASIARSVRGTADEFRAAVPELTEVLRERAARGLAAADARVPAK